MCKWEYVKNSEGKKGSLKIFFKIDRLKQRQIYEWNHIVCLTQMNYSTISERDSSILSMPLFFINLRFQIYKTNILCLTQIFKEKLKWPWVRQFWCLSHFNFVAVSWNGHETAMSETKKILKNSSNLSETLFFTSMSHSDEWYQVVLYYFEWDIIFYLNVSLRWQFDKIDKNSEWDINIVSLRKYALVQLSETSLTFGSFFKAWANNFFTGVLIWIWRFFLAYYQNITLCL